MHIKIIIITCLLGWQHITARAITPENLECYKVSTIVETIVEPLHLASVANHKEFFTLTHAEQDETYRQAKEISTATTLPNRTWVHSLTPLPEPLCGKAPVQGIPILHTMYIPLHSYTSAANLNDQITVKQINPSKEMSYWIKAAAVSFELPEDTIQKNFKDAITKVDSPLEFFVAYQDRTPVGCAVNYYTPDCVGIYWVGVDKKHRKKGIGNRIMDMALRSARQRRKLAFLQATPMGYPLYLKLGFMPLGYLGLY